MTEFVTDISRHVWQTKYRSTDLKERSIVETWRRVARALAAVEPSGMSEWEERFFGILKDFKFLPGGRILAGAGTGRIVTLFNCFVMGLIEDSIPGIFRALEEGAVTLQQGGGIGYDFSTLRPRGTSPKTVGSIASGPVSFMRRRLPSAAFLPRDALDQKHCRGAWIGRLPSGQSRCPQCNLGGFGLADPHLVGRHGNEER